MEDKLDPKKYCTLYLFRHGQTDWNKKKIIQGQKNSDLTTLGEKQAKKASKILKDVKVSAFFSSDLARAKQTAEIIAIDHKLAVITKKALREQRMGRFEGKTIKYFYKELRETLDQIEKMSVKERFKHKVEPGIESHHESATRFIRFFREVAVAYKNKNVVIVCHEGILRFFLIRIGYGDYDQLPWGFFTNAGCVKLMSDGVDFFVKETWGVSKNEN